MTKAYLEFAEWSSAGGAAGATTGGGGAAGGASGSRIEFQFNPSEFKVEKQAEWVASSTGMSGEPAPPQYIGPKAAGISLEMFLDASDVEDGDVSAQIQKLLDACLPTTDSASGSQPMPPKVKFGWDRVHFEGYVESVTAEYKLFREDGRPIRAKCTLSLKEIPRNVAQQNPTSGTQVIHRSIRTIAGDSLPAIAYREYGDPARWRLIAEANDIDDPMRLPTGVQLLVPRAGAALEAG